MNGEMNTPAPAFREVQRFRQWWVWAILLGSLGVAVGGTGYEVYRQEVPLTSLLVMLAVAAGMILLFVVLELVIEVRSDVLYVRFWPVRKQIPYDEITRCEARTYRPILEYGGWGIRWGWKGWAYNVSGKEGVQLELKSGRRLLLGSQRPGELAAAIPARLPAPENVSR